MHPLLLAALAAAPVPPIAQIGAQFVTETGATDVACSQTAERVMCYGVDEDGEVIAGTYADGSFTPYGVATTTAAPTGATTFGDGMWLVGTDIAPGTYRSITSEGCYYERLSDLSGDFDAILDNAFIDDGDPALVEILATDYAFDSSGCGTWALVG